MKKKLNCILLVDDNPANNYLNRRIIDKAEVSNKVISIETGKKALDYLTSEENEDFIKPDLIFLDINMPMMNGWEFVEEYEKIYEEWQKTVVIIMITTSINPEDEEKAKQIPLIQGFKKKPLTPHLLQEILEQHFVDYL